MKGKPHKEKPGRTEPGGSAAADDLPERWSVQRKTELVANASCETTRQFRFLVSEPSEGRWKRR